MKIKWLTKKQVQRAALRGRKAAILCSIKHWEQLSSADQKQVQGLDDASICCGHCALCTKYDFIGRGHGACGDCKLHCLVKSGGIPGFWSKASGAFDNVKEFADSKSWARWKRASKAVLRKIIKLYESEYGEYINVQRIGS